MRKIERIKEEEDFESKDTCLNKNETNNNTNNAIKDLKSLLGNF